MKKILTPEQKLARQRERVETACAAQRELTDDVHVLAAINCRESRLVATWLDNACICTVCQHEREQKLSALRRRPARLEYR